MSSGSIRLSIALLVLTCRLATGQDWWDGQYEADIMPNKAQPAWQVEKAKVTTDGKMLSIRGNTHWDGIRLSQQEGTWPQTQTPITVEIRFRWNGTDNQRGVIALQTKQNFMAVVSQDGKQPSIEWQTSGRTMKTRLSTGWNVLRILYDDRYGSMALLRKDDTSIDQLADWQTFNLAPVVSRWFGHRGEGKPSLFVGGISMDVDYIRWNSKSLCLPDISSNSQTSGSAAAPRHQLRWQRGTLQANGQLPAWATQIVSLINTQKFSEAMQQIDQSAEPGSEKLQGELAMAVAGHVGNHQPKDALRQAEYYLRRAAADGADVNALALLNELDAYQWVFVIQTDYRLLPARDAIMAGQFDKAVNILKQGKDQWYMYWSLTVLMQNTPIHPMMISKLDEAMEMAGVLSNGSSVRPLEFRILRQFMRHYPWANMAVPNDSLLYPQRLFDEMRRYYGWHTEMKNYRPMAGQGFREMLPKIKAIFPDDPLIRMYDGEQIPWVEQLQLGTNPSNAPQWAISQRELRMRVQYIIKWWVQNRQRSDGSLGGGFDDDCEILRNWSIPALLCEDPTVMTGIQRLVDGIWNSGEIVNGYQEKIDDVEHSSETTADSSVILALQYGDPLYFEQALATTRTVDKFLSGVTPMGHRHFKAMKLGAKWVDPNPRHQIDTQYSARIMRAPAMVAWYSHLPQASQLVVDWARSWNEDTLRAGQGKPAGIVPGSIRFEDDSVDAFDNWVDPELGLTYLWEPWKNKFVFGKMIAAYRLTGDDTYMKSMRVTMDLLRDAQQSPPSKSAKIGSLDWAKQQMLIRDPTMRWADGVVTATWYRIATGDTQYDDLAKQDPIFGKYLVDGDPQSMNAAHELELDKMRYNLPMYTDQVKTTDRVFLLPWSLLGAMGGSSINMTEIPMVSVTWPGSGDAFTALVRNHAIDGLSAWVYQFSKEAATIPMRLWQLEPGEYELTLSADADQDGKPDGSALQTTRFTVCERIAQTSFSLPTQQLCLVKIRQLQKAAPLPNLAPDLAFNKRDLSYPDKAKAGSTLQGKLTLHNIGSAKATDINIQIIAQRDDQSQTVEIFNTHIANLNEPQDLNPSKMDCQWNWKPALPGKYQLHVRVSCMEQEINSQNNTIKKPITVAP